MIKASVVNGKDGKALALRHVHWNRDVAAPAVKRPPRRPAGAHLILVEEQGKRTGVRAESRGDAATGTAISPVTWRTKRDGIRSESSRD